MISIQERSDLLRCLRNELAPCNPRVAAGGLAGFLEYRMDAVEGLNERHPDNLYDGYDKISERYYGETLTSKCFEKIYSINPRANRMGEMWKGRSDTIFNCWSFLYPLILATCKYGSRDCFEAHSRLESRTLFDGFTEDEKKELSLAFDKLGDYHHSLANFMPAPIGFNYAKGNFKTCNDMPDLLYALTREDSGLEWLRHWIDRYSAEYHLELFCDFDSGLPMGWACKRATLDLDDPESRRWYIGIVCYAVKLIEERAGNLWADNLNSQGFAVG